MAKTLMAVNSVLILLDTIDLNHHEEDSDQDLEVAIVEDLDHEIEDEDHAAVHEIEDVEVALDHVTVEEDLDQDLDPEINREIDQEAAPEEEADQEANPKIEVVAKRLLERKVVREPNHEADLDQETLATDELNSNRALLLSLQPSSIRLVRSENLSLFLFRYVT